MELRVLFCGFRLRRFRIEGLFNFPKRPTIFLYRILRVNSRVNRLLMATALLSKARSRPPANKS